MRRTLVFIATGALVVSACGRDKAETTQTTAPSGASTTVAPAAAGLDQGGFGDLGVICKPAADASKLTASDVGVTASEISIHTFSDPGYSGRLGLNQEMFDTATAFSAWCNEHGGINGRKINPTLSDGKLFEAQQRMVEACDGKAFMLVGGGNVFDDSIQKDRLGCKNGALPQVAAYLVTGQAADSDLTRVPIPNPGNQQPTGALKILGEKFPDTTQAVGVLTGALPTTKVVAQRNIEAMKSLGWKVVYEGEYSPAGETSWRKFVTDMQTKGVKGLYWVGEPTNLALLLSEAKGLGLNLDWYAADANHYDNQLFAEDSASVSNVFVRSIFYPFLDEADANKNVASKQYREIVQTYGKASKKIAYLGNQALSAWLLWAKAAGDCGADLTRDCVWDKLASVTSWTGGGLHAETNPGGGKASNCFNLLEAKGGKFTLVDIKADRGVYNCAEGNVMDLKGDYGTGEKCPNAAYATDPKPSTCNKQ